MFENVKKAIFGRAKTEGSDGATAVEAPPSTALDSTGGAVEAASGGAGSEGADVASDISMAESVVPPQAEDNSSTESGDGSAMSSPSEDKPDLERADVEGSEHEDAEAAAETAPPVEPVVETDTSTNDLERAKAEAAENYDKYIRAVAELENYKKRALRERADVLRYAGESLARDMLEIADHLQRALAQDMDGVREDFVKGLQLILDRFQAILEQHQVRGESSVGTPFDPMKHEALASVPTSDHPVGTVLEEFKRAYYFKDKLLRPAQVVVAKEDEPQE